jgi:ATP-dependent Clp protease ATP-binding subunit ClpA
VLGVFTDQAYNLILLAEDEARMLGQPAVEPEHLLLALARNGNVQQLLGSRGVTAESIHAVLVRAGGLGEDLVTDRVPRSPASEDALERAVDAAAARGVLGPSSEDVLLGLCDHAKTIEILRQVGIADVRELVDAACPVARAPVDIERVKSYALQVGMTRTPPRPGPIPPVFERFTTAAREAIRAGERAATSLGHEYVAPSDLLLGLLGADEGLAAGVLARHGVTLQEATRRAKMFGARPAPQVTGIYSDAARSVVAQDALQHAYRLGHPSIGTGHLLLAVLDADDSAAVHILGRGPNAERLARAVLRELPGNEHV